MGYGIPTVNYLTELQLQIHIAGSHRTMTIQICLCPTNSNRAQHIPS